MQYIQPYYMRQDSKGLSLYEALFFVLSAARLQLPDMKGDYILYCNARFVSYLKNILGLRVYEQVFHGNIVLMDNCHVAKTYQPLWESKTYWAWAKICAQERFGDAVVLDIDAILAEDFDLPQGCSLAISHIEKSHYGEEAHYNPKGYNRPYWLRTGGMMDMYNCCIVYFTKAGQSCKDMYVREAKARMLAEPEMLNLFDPTGWAQMCLTEQALLFDAMANIPFWDTNEVIELAGKGDATDLVVHLGNKKKIFESYSQTNMDKEMESLKGYAVSLGGGIAELLDTTKSNFRE